VNVASRMESTSMKDTAQCSSTFMDLLEQQWPEAAKLAEPQVNGKLGLGEWWRPAYMLKRETSYTAW